MLESLRKIHRDPRELIIEERPDNFTECPILHGRDPRHVAASSINGISMQPERYEVI
jgi:hypothetical protein